MTEMREEGGGGERMGKKYTECLRWTLAGLWKRDRGVNEAMNPRGTNGMQGMELQLRGFSECLNGLIGFPHRWAHVSVSVHMCLCIYMYIYMCVPMRR